MAAVITHASGEIVPEVVNGFEGSSEVRSIVHTVLGREDPDITFRPAGLRRGTLLLVFADGASANAAAAVLRIPQQFTLSDEDVPEVGMDFVVAGGDVRQTLDPETRTVWIVTVPFQEVTP